MSKKKKQNKLAHEKVEGRVKILKAYLYKSHHVVLRMIGDDYFEYVTEYNGQIYSSYIIITPRKGEKKLSESDIRACIGMINAGAEATLDGLLGEEIDDKTKEYVELFEAHREKFEGTSKKK